MLAGNGKAIMRWLIVVWVSCCATFTITSLVWGTDVGESYHMLYVAPTVFTIFDAIFFFVFLPENERTTEAFRMIIVYSIACSSPIILLFIPVLVKIMFDSVWVDIVIPLVPLVKKGLKSATETVMENELANCRFDGKMKSCGYELHLELIFKMGLLMLFPGELEPFVFYWIIVVDFVHAALTLWHLSTSDLSNEETTDLALAHVESDVPLLCTTLGFLSMFTIIYFGWNTEHYHLYNCFDDREYFSTLHFAAMHGGIQFFIFLAGRHCVVPVQKESAFLNEQTYEFASNVAVVICLFTSCWFIQHDGLAVLEKLGKCH